LHILGRTGQRFTVVFKATIYQNVWNRLDYAHVTLTSFDCINLWAKVFTTLFISSPSQKTGYLALEAGLQLLVLALKVSISCLVLNIKINK
jgi:hypothetical protein